METIIDSRPGSHPSSPRASSDWSSLSSHDFWNLAEQVQERTLAHCKRLFSRVASADPDLLRSLLMQYRFFTVYYIPDLSLLISRLPDGRVRSFLADILYDELGSGDPARAHPRLYDNFLSSIGVEREDRNRLCLASNARLLDGARRALVDPTNTPAFGVGLRGMGGECICQVYIAQLFEYLAQNPYIKHNESRIDWTFWDLHVGDHDVQHRMRTREVIDSEFVSESGPIAADLGRGYCESIDSWDLFWRNIFGAEQDGFTQSCYSPVRGNVNVQLIEGA